MSVDAAIIIVIGFRDEACAELLRERWQNLKQWCGFNIVPCKAIKKHHITLLAYVKREGFFPSFVPSEAISIGVESIGISDTANIDAVKHNRWPGDYDRVCNYNVTIKWLQKEVAHEDRGVHV